VSFVPYLTESGPARIRGGGGEPAPSRGRSGPKTGRQAGRGQAGSDGPAPPKNCRGRGWRTAFRGESASRGQAFGGPAPGYGAASWSRECAARSQAGAKVRAAGGRGEPGGRRPQARDVGWAPGKRGPRGAGRHPAPRPEAADEGDFAPGSFESASGAATGLTGREEGIDHRIIGRFVGLRSRQAATSGRGPCPGEVEGDLVSRPGADCNAGRAGPRSSEGAASRVDCQGGRPGPEAKKSWRG